MANKTVYPTALIKYVRDHLKGRKVVSIYGDGHTREIRTVTNELSRIRLPVFPSESPWASTFHYRVASKAEVKAGKALGINDKCRSIFQLIEDLKGEWYSVNESKAEVKACEV